MRRIRPHPLELRGLSSGGVSRSGSLTSKQLVARPASSVSLQIAKGFVKSSCRVRRAKRGPSRNDRACRTARPKGDPGPAARQGSTALGQPLADCDFNQAALHPAHPIKRRTSTQRTQAPESVDTRRASALDPLENGIGAKGPAGFVKGFGRRPDTEAGARAEGPASESLRGGKPRAAEVATARGLGL